MMSARAAAGLAAIITSLATSVAMARETAVTCVNPASGASWQIHIDYDRRTVNSNSANISGAEISWHDASDGSNYTLDRKSGVLTAIVASSTGGYFLHHRCKLNR